ncbi:MFS transporter [Candidatus Solirubrobacter pratensis]|uniref:MFS transporter n=1 Tax=Candidatus Solirubrobacter pratensis TaxID=1298857 RepID=UPI0004259BF1|nr:MFS transporter [Candidatus Solirubrobacter pratensis]
MRRLLAIRDARIYLAGQSLSLLGDTALWLALGIWAKDLTGSNSAAGLAIFCVMAPQLLSPLAGLLVDRVRRRPLLLVVNLVTAGVVLLLLAAGERVWVIYGVGAVYGASYTLLASGQSALLATLVPPDLLGDANALLQTVREGLRLVAPVAGAGLYAAAGGAAVAVLDAVTFAVAAAALAALHVREARPEPHGEPWRRAVTAGARHIRRTPPLKHVVTAGALVLLALGFSETLLFAIADEGLHRPVSFVGVLMAVQGVGAVAGAALATRVMRRAGEERLAAAGMAVLAAGMLLMASGALGIVLAGKALFGFGIPWIVVGAMTLLQRLTPGPLQGRTYSAAELLLGVPQTFSVALGAALITVVDYRAMLLAMAVVTTAAAVYLQHRGEKRPRARFETAPAR